MAGIGLYWRTVRHLKARQVYWRARYMLRRKLGRCPGAKRMMAAPSFDEAALDRLQAFLGRLARLFPPDPGDLNRIRRGEFVFLNRAVDGAGRPPWERRDLPKLWRYHLHYFEYFQTLALHNIRSPHGPQPGDTALVVDWARDWITRNPPGTEVAWDAFPTAARLMHWAMAASVFRKTGETFRRSYAQQASVLAHHLEYDLGANHLLQNAAGLAVAGTVLNDRLAEKGLRLLERELASQILPDGGHIERSPMYHAHALEQCLLVRAVLADPPPFLESAITRMADFLAALLHPDGDIPLFGDSALKAGIPPRILLKLADGAATGIASRPPAAHARPESGFYILGPESGAGRMIVKAGAPGPPWQLGHAHADIGTYEFSLAKRRILVDSGVHGYAESPFRAHCRSVAAHNTARVNGREPLEAWSSFRVGRRYRITAKHWTVNDQEACLFFTHDGYRPCRHERRVDYRPEGIWIVQDEFSGPGPLNVESFVHLHPDLVIEPYHEGWAISGDGVYLWLVPFGTTRAGVISGQRDPEQGWYCPEFGRAIPAPVLTLEAEGTSKLRLGYVIIPEGVCALTPESLKALLRQMNQPSGTGKP
jgi:uncharacterized heparinase superfamily protein